MFFCRMLGSYILEGRFFRILSGRKRFPEYCVCIVTPLRIGAYLTSDKEMLRVDGEPKGAIRTGRNGVLFLE